MARRNFEHTGDDHHRDLLALRSNILAAQLTLSCLRLYHLTAKAGFDPNQPRVPAGNPDGGQWTSTGSGDFRRALARALADDRARGRHKPKPRQIRLAQAPPRRVQPVVPVRINGRLRFATPVQVDRLTRALLWREGIVRKVHNINPNWRPRRSAPPSSVEGRIRTLEAEAREAETVLRNLDHPRPGLGHNQGPPLRPPSGPVITLPGTSTPLPARELLTTHRLLLEMSPHVVEARRKEDGTVAVARVGNKIFFGVNSQSTGYVREDRIAALAMREVLVRKYPRTMNTKNLGGKPNDALFHAEAILLLRAARANGGTLRGQKIEITTDRRLCDSCEMVLPLLSRELGLDTLTIHAPRGITHTLRHGQWTGGRR